MADTMVRPAGNAGPVLVLGATGQQGGAVAEALRAEGRAVRALVRDPDGRRAQALAERGVLLVAGDLDDAPAIRTAMTGASCVFSVQPSSGQGAAYGVTDAQEIGWGKRIADLAAEAGVRHLVYSSVNAVGSGPTGMGHFDSKLAIETHIRSLGIPATIVRPAAFMELLLLPGMGLEQGHYAFFLRPGQSAQVIAVPDIGRIVATIFREPERFAGQTLEIAGDTVTGAGLGRALSRAAGRPIAYGRFPDALLRENPFLGRLAALIDEGPLAGHADIAALDRTFGPSLRFEAWLEGPGRALLEAALGAEAGPVALR